MRELPQVCRHGHVGQYERTYRSTGKISVRCSECHRQDNAKRALAKYRADPEKANNYQRALFQKNPEYRAKRCAQMQAYKRAHRGEATAAQRARDAAQLQRTPQWADLKKIEKIYITARAMTVAIDESYLVDHVIPLRGKKVSGLHVHTNLQILPRMENAKKHNKFEVDIATRLDA